MKTIIAGSRNVEPGSALLDAARRTLQLACGVPLTEVISGCARGVDTAGEKFAKENNLPVVQFPVTDEDWKRGKIAGILRNEKMGDYADAAIIIWDGESPGSRHMMSYMQKLGKPFLMVRL